MLIAHLADLTEADGTAFEHALGLAARSGAELASVHVAVGFGAPPDFPSAADTLACWGRSEQVDHRRVSHRCRDDLTDTLLDAIRTVDPDLLVCLTHSRAAFARLFSGSIAQAVARNVTTPTLLLPQGGKRFIDAASGALSLERILVPVGSDLEARQGCEAALRLLRLAGCTHAEIVLLHVDDGRPMPTPDMPAGQRWSTRARGGPLEDAILETASELDADCVVMVSRGHDGPEDILFGSHTERVLQRSERPLLWVPSCV